MESVEAQGRQACNRVRPRSQRGSSALTLLDPPPQRHLHYQLHLGAISLHLVILSCCLYSRRRLQIVYRVNSASCCAISLAAC